MDHKALSGLILRIAGLLILVYSIVNSVKYFSPFLNARPSSDTDLGLLVASLSLSLLLPTSLALILIYFPSSIANRITKFEGVDIRAGDIAPLQRVAFSAIGLWLALYAIIDASYFYARVQFYTRYMMNSPYANDPPMLLEDFGGLVACAVQLLAGIALLIGHRGVVKILERLRR